MRVHLLNDKTVTTTSDAFHADPQGLSNRTYQASIEGSGTVTATVIIEGSNDETNYLTLGTISLSGTNSASDGFVSSANWSYVRARLTAITGTSATVTVTMGV